MSAYELPNRSELEGKEVTLELHPWAIPGPTRGVFLGQGERGLSIRIEGGGRFSYRHSEVRSVKAVAGARQRRLVLRLAGRAVLVAALAVVVWVAISR
ncbi:hypothetical protein [Streptomyces bullii]|uniref:Uncharacterized protein n=1 Tax=Streptomyces bullii TaxID=349910 RepID=A0ABW0UKT4_9ACTN